jgi:transcriptional regulator with XRE-family HTH domain
MKIADALDSERKRQGISVNRLASIAGQSPGRVHSILTGETANAGILTVLSITRALGKSLGWLEKQLNDRREP